MIKRSDMIVTLWMRKHLASNVSPSYTSRIATRPGGTAEQTPTTSALGDGRIRLRRRFKVAHNLVV